LVDDGALVFKAGTSIKTCPLKEITATKLGQDKPYPTDDDLTFDLATGKMTGNSVGYTGEDTTVIVTISDKNDVEITFTGYTFKNKCDTVIAGIDDDIVIKSLSQTAGTATSELDAKAMFTDGGRCLVNHSISKDQAGTALDDDSALTLNGDLKVEVDQNKFDGTEQTIYVRAVPSVGVDYIYKEIKIE
jgi:hypothetical protein